MTLLSLLAQYNLVQTRIDALLRSEETNVADLSLLMRQSRDLRTDILKNPPRNREEAAQKLACLMNLMHREMALQGIDGELCEVLDTAINVCDHLLNTKQPEPGVATEAPARKPHRDAIFGGSIADYVAFAEDRVSLIGTDYTYIATSVANAEFFGRSPVGLMGAHIADFIGDMRFETRTKARLDACFNGSPQSYHHAQHSGGEARIIRCDMKPVNSSDGHILGALVYSTDVTEQVRKLRPSSETMAHQVIRSF